jgi:hypothetical protein
MITNDEYAYIRILTEMTGLFHCTIPHLLEATEKSHEKPQSGQPVIRPRLELSSEYNFIGKRSLVRTRRRFQNNIIMDLR